jgi:hypothetical protein
MKTWEVEIRFGSGGDTDSIATYLVYAKTEEEAEDMALGNSRHLINATANLIRNPGAVDEMDYDGVLGHQPADMSGGIDTRPVDVPSWAGGRSGYFDQDGVVVAVREDGSYRVEEDSDRKYDIAKEEGYDISDPKHPRHHDVYSDVADMKENE